MILYFVYFTYSCILCAFVCIFASLDLPEMHKKPDFNYRKSDVSYYHVVHFELQNSRQFTSFRPKLFICTEITCRNLCKYRMGMGVHAAGTAAGWGQGLPGGPQLPPHHATTVTAPPGVQAAPPPPPPPAQMMAYPMQQFQVTITFLSLSLFLSTCILCYLLYLLLEPILVSRTLLYIFLHQLSSFWSIRWKTIDRNASLQMYSNDSYAREQLYFRMREGYTYDINPWKLLSKNACSL